jgi:hypothetical protein
MTFLARDDPAHRNPQGVQQFEKREVKLGLSDGIRAEVLSGVGEKDLLRKPVRAVATGTKI